MALDEIKIWAMDVSGDATPLSSAAQTDTERQLEDTLVQNPEMLAPGLSLVGQQTRTDEGWLDLLGVDEDGRLVVFELKRGTLSREAVAQVIDYASFLDSKSEPELINYISERGNLHNVNKVEGFEEWYGHQFGENESASLKPVRMVLVGLGVDERTTRMVQFLAGRDVDISLLTFHGYSYDGNTLLARQVQVEAASEPAKTTQPGRRLGRRRRRELLEQRIDEHTEQYPEARKLWDAVLDMVREYFPNPVEVAGMGGSEWAKRRLRLRMHGGGRAQAALQLGPFEPHPELVSLIFFPSAVSLCLDKFSQLRRELPYETWPANSPKREDGVIEIQFSIKSLTEWETRKEKLAEVVRSVYEACLAREED